AFLKSGVDPFTGKFKWLRVWWTNSNPRLIFGYYLDQVKKDGYIPLVTQSDPGPENFLCLICPDCSFPLPYKIFSNVFKWVAIPWFQSELDAYAKLHNSTKRRAQRNKILPHGPPDDIEEHPHRYNALDFKVSMSCTSVLEVY
ncbi:hypothetical protein K435DRAFT_693705, partial [Dendrothele bispora CBS 962.96]